MTQLSNSFIVIPAWSSLDSSGIMMNLVTDKAADIDHGDFGELFDAFADHVTCEALIWEKDSVTGNKSDWASGSVRFDGLSDRF